MASLRLSEAPLQAGGDDRDDTATNMHLFSSNGVSAADGVPTSESALREPVPMRQPVPQRVLAARGSSLRQGPHRRFSLGWLLSFHGLEYVQLYLWLLKDWSWSQLRWFYTSMVFGTLAVLWAALLVVLALRAGVLSEAYLAAGVLLWLLANYVWMVGDLWDDDMLARQQHEDEGLYHACEETAKYISLSSVLWVAVYFWAVIPLQLFAHEQALPLVARINHNCPPPRFGFVFSTFREYETLHVFFWALKDLFWVWESSSGYLAVYVATLILTLDLMWLSATHRDQYIDFVHFAAVFLWIFANGWWALSELSREVPVGDISPDAWLAYSCPSNLDHGVFLFRCIASYCFFAAALVIVLFYVRWLCLPLRLPLPPAGRRATAKTLRDDHADLDLALGLDLDSDSGPDSDPDTADDFLAVI